MNEAVPFPDRKNQIKGQRKPRPEALGVHSLRRHPVFFFFFFSQIFLFLFRFFFFFFEHSFLQPPVHRWSVAAAMHHRSWMEATRQVINRHYWVSLSLSLSFWVKKRSTVYVAEVGEGVVARWPLRRDFFFYWVVTEFCFVLFFALLALRSISGLWLSNRNRHHCSFFYFRFFTKDVWRASFIDGSYLNWVFLMRP